MARPAGPEMPQMGKVDLRSPSQQSVQVSVVLPCYNEESNVAAEVERICQALDGSGYTYELIVVDDGSADRTWTELQGEAARRGAVRPVRFEVNGGPGTARRLGTERARGSVVVWTDADMTYPNERIPELFRVLDEDTSCDQVVGARTSEQGSLRIARAAAKWLIRKLAERLTGTTIPDLNSGFRAFRRRTALPYLHLLPPGFSCVTTITLAFLADQHCIRYVPVPYSPRSGRSKFRVVRDTYQYLLQVLAVTMYFSPLRVLMPVALFLLFLGTVMGIRGIIGKGGIFPESVMTFMSGLIVFSLALFGDLIAKSRYSTGAAPGHFPLGSWVRRARRSASRSGIHSGGRSTSTQRLTEPRSRSDENRAGARLSREPSAGPASAGRAFDRLSTETAGRRRTVRRREVGGGTAGSDGRAVPAARQPPQM